MQIFVLVGLIGIPVLLILGIVSSNGSVVNFIDPGSVFITVGGTLMAFFIFTPPGDFKNVMILTKKIIFPDKSNTREIIPTLVSFAEKARREGLLALEDNMEEIQDKFLRKGIQLVIDGTDPELVKAIMRTELSYIEERHGAGASMFQNLSSIAPAFGMIGTLIGLVIMLRNLEDPSSIGAGMSTALITTLYGAVLANGFFTPIATRLQANSAEELLMRQVMVEGMLSIQSGDNPRIVEEKLLAFLAPKDRKSTSEEGGEEE